jgi:hypothetical protein
LRGRFGGCEEPFRGSAICCRNLLGTLRNQLVLLEPLKPLEQLLGLRALSLGAMGLHVAVALCVDEVVSLTQVKMVMMVLLCSQRMREFAVALRALEERARWVLTSLNQLVVVTSFLVAEDCGDCCDAAVVVLRRHLLREARVPIQAPR